MRSMGMALELYLLFSGYSADNEDELTTYCYCVIN